jgi:hypothetical protein
MYTNVHRLNVNAEQIVLFPLEPRNLVLSCTPVLRAPRADPSALLWALRELPAGAHRTRRTCPKDGCPIPMGRSWACGRHTNTSPFARCMGQGTGRGGQHRHALRRCVPPVAWRCRTAWSAAGRVHLEQAGGRDATGREGVSMNAHGREEIPAVCMAWSWRTAQGMKHFTSLPLSRYTVLVMASTSYCGLFSLPSGMVIASAPSCLCRAFRT